MEKRWILFFIVTFLVIHFYIVTTQQGKKKVSPGELEGKKVQGVEGELTKEEDRYSTLSLERISKETVSSEQEKTLLKQQTEKKIEIETKLSKMVFGDRGARPVSWELTDPIYSEEMPDGKKYPVQIIPQENKLLDRELPLEINFREYNAKRYSDFNEIFYEVEQTRSNKGEDVLIFTSPVIDDLQVIKKYTIPNNKYYIELEIAIINNSESAIRIDDDKKGISMSWGPGIGRIPTINKSDRGFITAYYKVEGKMEMVSARQDRPVEDFRKVFWGGLETKYFFAAVFPGEIISDSKRSFEATKVLVRGKNVNPLYLQEKYPNFPMTIELYEPSSQIQPKGKLEYHYRIYVAPKNYNLLKKESYPVSQILFHNSYNWMRALCISLLVTLNWLNSYIKNYGVAIILLTILVKIVTHPLTHKGMKLQAKAMAEQQKIRPFIEEIQKKYKSNPQKRNAEMMKLYKEHGINPFGMLRGCVPMLIQMPIFFALYKLFNQSIDLKGQTFLWIKDLSLPDALFHFKSMGIDSFPLLGTSFNLLPILMGASQFFVSRVTTTNIKDPTQRQMMIMMPIVFTFILYSFPSGLTLYWLIQNIWQFAHQLITNKLIKKEEKPASQS